jgi:hypothetical protein
MDAKCHLLPLLLVNVVGNVTNVLRAGRFSLSVVGSYVTRLPIVGSSAIALT